MDYYKILNVPKNASQDDIKRAYRKMASKHHPDKGGTKEEFQKIEEAYRTLSDSNARQQYDNPASNIPGGFGFNFGANPFEDIINQFTRQQQQRRTVRAYTVTVFVTLEQIAFGSNHVITVQTDAGNKVFNIQIPKGIEDGQRLRYDGLMEDGAPLMITFRVQNHSIFGRRGLDLYSDIDVSVFDLILGTTLSFKTIGQQELAITIHPKTKPGTQLRISNHGLEGSTGRGDQYILINAVIPDIISDEIVKLLEKERNQST